MDNGIETPHTATPPDTAVEYKPSPLSPGRLFDLFAHPRKFFSEQLALDRAPYLFAVTWAYGIAEAIDRVDRSLLKRESGSPAPVESWLAFWELVLFLGAIGGVFLYYLGGWWYRVRLRWSGAVEPDKRLARLTYIYSSFIYAAPAVLLPLSRTLAYPSYLEGYNSADASPLFIAIFPLWSFLASYSGATTLFDLSVWKARLWFLILPSTAYVIAMVLRMLDSSGIYFFTQY